MESGIEHSNDEGQGPGSDAQPECSPRRKWRKAEQQENCGT